MEIGRYRSFCRWAVHLLTPRLIKQEVPYLVGAQSKRFAPIIFNNCHPFFLNLMEAIQSTDPVDFRNFNLVIWQLKDCERWAGDENETLIRRYASEKVREACISVFGRQFEMFSKCLYSIIWMGRLKKLCLSSSIYTDSCKSTPPLSLPIPGHIRFARHSLEAYFAWSIMSN